MAALLKSSLIGYTIEHKREFEEGLKNVEDASIQLEAVMRNILSYVSTTCSHQATDLQSYLLPRTVRVGIRLLPDQSTMGSIWLGKTGSEVSRGDTERRRALARHTRFSSKK